MAQGYNRYNLMLKVKEVNEIYLINHKKGETADYIFHNLIQPRFYISRTTFYRYLATPYKKELTELEQKFQEEEQRKREKRHNERN
jgi:hypothetical protein